MITIDHINTTQLDSILNELQASKNHWTQTRIEHKIALLHEIRIRLRQAAQEWVDVSIQGKNIENLVAINPAVAGEEWSSGPWALGVMLNALIDTLTFLQEGKQLYEDITRKHESISKQRHQGTVMIHRLYRKRSCNRSLNPQ